jgi:prevent-host-death family protein
VSVVKLSEDIRPMSDLKSNGADIVRQVNATHRPVVLTRHGRGVAVVLSLEDYEEVQELRKWRDLSKALDDGVQEFEDQGPVDSQMVVSRLRRLANGI